MVGFFVWRVFHAVVEHLLLRLGMRQQLGGHLLEQGVALGAAVAETLYQRGDLVVV